MRARLEPLGVDVHEEVPRDVHEVEVVWVLHPRSVVAHQRELHRELDLARVVHVVGVEEDLGRKRDNGLSLIMPRKMEHRTLF